MNVFKLDFSIGFDTISKYYFKEGWKKLDFFTILSAWNILKMLSMVNSLLSSLSLKKLQLVLTLIGVVAPRKERSEDCMEFLLCETSRGTLRFKKPIQLFDFIPRKSEKKIDY